MSNFFRNVTSGSIGVGQVNFPTITVAKGGATATGIAPLQVTEDAIYLGIAITGAKPWFAVFCFSVNQEDNIHQILADMGAVLDHAITTSKLVIDKSLMKTILIASDTGFFHQSRENEWEDCIDEICTALEVPNLDEVYSIEGATSSLVLVFDLKTNGFIVQR